MVEDTYEDIDLALWSCYECCVELIRRADDEGLLIGVGREHPGQKMGPGERRMRRAVARVQRLRALAPGSDEEQ